MGGDFFVFLPRITWLRMNLRVSGAGLPTGPEDTNSNFLAKLQLVIFHHGQWFITYDPDEVPCELAASASGRRAQVAQRRALT